MAFRVAAAGTAFSSSEHDEKNNTTNAAVMFEEGDSVTAVVLGDESEFDTDEYTVNVNYGNETVSYKLVAVNLVPFVIISAPE